ncbi:MazG-like family protein [Actinobacillus equuli]|uniref:MazG-like family protein n=1 Tax=Actinobacillus equuli TaxID=718 RepID=UPI002441B29A|nr:MazG-like family protein [Actinobacillus equuli]WGE48027.1 MazG-like family protein [Actinobacillus equuli subsp. equuli]
MQIQDYQNWVREFYQTQGWYRYNPFIRVNFLSEEVGEVARAVRAIEIGRDRPNETEASYQEKRACLIEELGDVLDNLFILADKYDISIEEVIEKHQAKFIKRYVKGE